MAYKGQIIGSCTTDRPLTGKGNCDRVEGLTTSVILTAVNAYYPLDSEQFILGVDDWVYEDGVMRMMPVNGIFANTPTGGEITTSQVGYGPTTPVELSAYNDIFQIQAGLCLYKELSQANGNPYRVFRRDKNGYIYGTVVTRGGIDYFAGFEANIYAYTTKATDGSTAGGVFLGIYYGANYENEMKNINVYSISNVPEGLLGVSLQKGPTTGTARVITSCGGTDITLDHTWNATDFVNASGANPTTVTTDQSVGLLTFTPIAAYKVNKASILKEDGIEGLEGINQLTDLT